MWSWLGVGGGVARCATEAERPDLWEEIPKDLSFPVWCALACVCVTAVAWVSSGVVRRVRLSHQGQECPWEKPWDGDLHL